MNTTRRDVLRIAMMAATTPILKACGGGGGTPASEEKPPITNPENPQVTPIESTKYFQAGGTFENPTEIKASELIAGKNIFEGAYATIIGDDAPDGAHIIADLTGGLRMASESEPIASSKVDPSIAHLSNEERMVLNDLAALSEKQKQTKVDAIAQYFDKDKDEVLAKAITENPDFAAKDLPSITIASDSAQFILINNAAAFNLGVNSTTAYVYVSDTDADLEVTAPLILANVTGPLSKLTVPDDAPITLGNLASISIISSGVRSKLKAPYVNFGQNLGFGTNVESDYITGRLPGGIFENWTPVENNELTGSFDDNVVAIGKDGQGGIAVYVDTIAKNSTVFAKTVVANQASCEATLAGDIITINGNPPGASSVCYKTDGPQVQ